MANEYHFFCLRLAPTGCYHPIYLELEDFFLGKAVEM